MFIPRGDDALERGPQLVIRRPASSSAPRANTGTPLTCRARPSGLGVRRRLERPEADAPLGQHDPLAADGGRQPSRRAAAACRGCAATSARRREPAARPWRRARRRRPSTVSVAGGAAGLDLDRGGRVAAERAQARAHGQHPSSPSIRGRRASSSTASRAAARARRAATARPARGPGRSRERGRAAWCGRSAGSRCRRASSASVRAAGAAPRAAAPAPGSGSRARSGRAAARRRRPSARRTSTRSRAGPSPFSKTSATVAIPSRRSNTSSPSAGGSASKRVRNHQSSAVRRQAAGVAGAAVVRASPDAASQPSRVRSRGSRSSSRAPGPIRSADGCVVERAIASSHGAASARDGGLGVELAPAGELEREHLGAVDDPGRARSEAGAPAVARAASRRAAARSSNADAGHAHRGEGIVVVGGRVAGEQLGQVRDQLVAEARRTGSAPGAARGDGAAGSRAAPRSSSPRRRGPASKRTSSVYGGRTSARTRVRGGRRRGSPRPSSSYSAALWK